MINGIDISHWQTITSLAPAKALGYEFAYIKANDGVTKDDKLDRNFELVVEAEMIPGFYGYYKNNVNKSGEEQAEAHLKYTLPLAAQIDNKVLYPHVDVEHYYQKPGLQRENSVEIWKWIRLVEQETGKCGMYSSQYMWKMMTTNPNYAFYYPGWIAQYTGLKLSLYPIGWDAAKVKFWQWAIIRKHNWAPPPFPGFTGELDVNRFFGTLDELKALAGYEVEPAPPPVEMPEVAHVSIELDGWNYSGDVRLEE